MPRNFTSPPPLPLSVKERIERAFRAGFSAGEDYVHDFHGDKRGDCVRDLEANPDQEEALRRFLANPPA